MSILAPQVHVWSRQAGREIPTAAGTVSAIMAVTVRQAVVAVGTVGDRGDPLTNAHEQGGVESGVPRRPRSLGSEVWGPSCLVLPPSAGAPPTGGWGTCSAPHRRGLHGVLPRETPPKGAAPCFPEEPCAAASPSGTRGGRRALVGAATLAGPQRAGRRCPDPTLNEGWDRETEAGYSRERGGKTGAPSRARPKDGVLIPKQGVLVLSHFSEVANHLLLLTARTFSPGR